MTKLPMYLYLDLFSLRVKGYRMQKLTQPCTALNFWMVKQDHFPTVVCFEARIPSFNFG